MINCCTERGSIMLMINQLKVRIDKKSINLEDIISKKLLTSSDNILDYKILRRSIDARKKADIQFVYNLLVKVKGEKTILSKKINNVTKQLFNKKVEDFTKYNYKENKKQEVINVKIL